MISVKILADSMSPEYFRLTTMECTFPRFILAEVNTHRDFSRNSASSRAIPVEKMIANVMEKPFVPGVFPINRPGMSATDYISAGHRDFETLAEEWLIARDKAVHAAGNLLKYNIHKQMVNRLLEPFMWHTAIISATEWDNFFTLRCNNATTEPHFWRLACLMRDELVKSIPKMIGHGDYHLPLIEPEELAELPLYDLMRMSTARIAAVSYLRQDKREYDKEIARYELLRDNTHLSPFEHIATPTPFKTEWANFRGWRQHRRDIEVDNSRR